MTCCKLSLKIYMGFLLTKICLADGKWQMVAIKLEWQASISLSASAAERLYHIAPCMIDKDKVHLLFDLR